MKRNAIAIVLVTTIMSFMRIAPNERKKDRFIIKGTISGLKDDTQLFLIQYSTKDTIANTKAKDEQFILQGKVPKGTEYYYIRLDTAISHQRSQEMLLVNDDLTLKGTLTEWPKIQLLGSLPHNEYQQFVDLWKTLKKPVNDAKANYIKNLAKRDSLSKEIKIHEQQLLDKTKEFIKEHNNSLYVADIIARMEGDFRYQEMYEMYNSLTPVAKASYFGSILRENLDIANIREKVKPGAVIPDFAITAIGQAPTTMHQLASKQKLTLIDFWASWCAPCRQQVPNLKKVYKTFNSKGFDVIGIALNDRESDWKKALMKDNTPWINMRDRNNELFKLFHVAQIPAYILVDSQGKLISFNCTGSSVSNFGPTIKGELLFNTVDSLLRQM